MLNYRTGVCGPLRRLHFDKVKCVHFLKQFLQPVYSCHFTIPTVVTLGILRSFVINLFAVKYCQLLVLLKMAGYTEVGHLKSC
jgi:hypothetical protein